MTDPIEALHEKLFNFVPAKHGTAYERLTALVLAWLGWEGVVHDLRQARKGRRAKHQLDVVARNSSGVERRLVVECKDMSTQKRKRDRVVGKGIADTLVGVLAQLDDADGAIVSTVPFTKGARDVCTDEGIEMIALRPFNEDIDPSKFVMQINLTSIARLPSEISNITPKLGRIEGEPEEVAIEMTTSTRVQTHDGEEAETVLELLQLSGMDVPLGTYARDVAVPEPRWVQLTGGRAEIIGFTYDEEVRGVVNTQVIKGDGEPVLTMYRVNADGEEVEGRLVVDQALFAWDIDSSKKVIPRGLLINTEGGATQQAS